MNFEPILPMLPHQKRLFEKFKDSDLIAVPWLMGRGKSKFAVDIAWYKYQKRQIDRVLIFARSIVDHQWASVEFNKHCPEAKVFLYQNSRSKKYHKSYIDFLNKPGFKVLVVAVESTISKHCREVIEKFIRPVTMIILDEATTIKNPESQRSKYILQLRREWEGPAMWLSGTSLAKNPIDLWALYEFLSPRILRCKYGTFRYAYTIWQEIYTKNRYGEIEKRRVPLQPKTFIDLKKSLEKDSSPEAIYRLSDKTGILAKDIELISKRDRYYPYRNVNRIVDQIKAVTAFIEPGEDVVLPERRYDEIVLQLPDMYKKHITTLKETASLVHNGELLTLKNAAGVFQRAMLICGGHVSVEGGHVETAIEGPNPKLDYILDSLDEIGDAQFLVFAAFTVEVKMLTQALSTQLTVAAIHGDTPNAERARLVTAFQRGEIQCLVCNARVAGYGLNLQCATLQIWYSRDFFNEARIQAEARTNRYGSTETSVYKDLIYDCPAERTVIESNKLGLSMNDAFHRYQRISDMI